MLFAIGTSIQQPAQAQARPSNPQTKSTCSAAYFDNPGYMYQPVTQQQMEAVDKRQNDPKWDVMISQITSFSAPLDSPLGYVLSSPHR